MARGAEQAHRGDAHGEAVTGLRRRDREGGTERRGLGAGQRGKLRVNRGQQVGQGRERELGLGLDAAGP